MRPLYRGTLWGLLRVWLEQCLTSRRIVSTFRRSGYDSGYRDKRVCADAVVIVDGNIGSKETVASE
jgi:hypothetical protein